jgi:transcriptional regulator with XRE-family HTH domain
MRSDILSMGTRRKTEDSDKVGHYIREWRKHRGLTLEQLAGRLDVATSSISQLERGKQGYSQAMLEALAVALNCEAWELISVNPSKAGEVVDLMRLINESKDKERAIRILRAMNE